MRDLSTIAKLLAEEDIFVQNKNQSTASFDVKNRVLSLPIWKEMSKPIQELMTIHEVGHALETPLEQLEQAEKENIEFSVLNVLEDVRIEKSVQKKYPGSVRIFKKGYQELISMNFFGTKELNISELNLIDRINLHYKHHSDIPFSIDENVWVQKANQTVTPDDVLNLAKEIIDFVGNNPESQSKSPSQDDIEGAKDMVEDDTNSQDDENQSDDFDTSNSPSAENETKTLDNNQKDSNSDSTKSDDTDGVKSEEKQTVAQNQAKGSDTSDTKEIISVTDIASRGSVKNLLSDATNDISYASIPKLIMKNVIVPNKEILEIFNEHYTCQMEKRDTKYYDSTRCELEKLKKESKKTVAYMVKEFEMKKSADLYSRSSTSKTGSLDMGKLHTYKYNDDLFAKITTLPGETNHGLVLFLDWSGSMASNLIGTLNQLFNIIWFCNRTQIPFEVFAFSNNSLLQNDERPNQKFKSEDLSIPELKLLQFFSNKMSLSDQNTMMHNLYMMAFRWSWMTTENDRSILRYECPMKMELNSTPLNDTIIAAMDLVPAFQKKSGVQKTHIIFLTDGASNEIRSKFTIKTDTTGKDFETVDRDFCPYYSSYRSAVNANQNVYFDPTTNTRVNSKDITGRSVQTKCLLKLLKKRCPEASIVNFFVAGEGRNGSVRTKIFQDIIGYEWEHEDLIKNYRKSLRKDNFVSIEGGQGFDTIYILPGMNDLDMDSELEVEVGASKSELKKAFKQMSNKKMLNRPLLNNFIKMVA